MTLFINKTADDIATKINDLVDNFSQKIKGYQFTDDLMEKRSQLADNFLLTAGLTAMATIPTGMMIGSLYMQNIAAGGAMGAILPVGLGLGSGLLSYLNYKTKNDLVNDKDFEKTLQSKHNEKHGNDFLHKLGDLNIGDSFKEIKAIVEDSVKNPPYHQENIVKDVQKTLKKNNLQ